MKKIMIIIKIIIILLVIIFVNYSNIYADSINGVQPIFWHLYGYGKNEHDASDAVRVYDNYYDNNTETNQFDNLRDRWDGAVYIPIWLHATENLLNYFRGNTPEKISNENELMYIQNAKQLIMIDMFDYLNYNGNKEVAVAVHDAFEKETGYTANKEGFDKYYADKCVPALYKISAAVSIKDKSGLYYSSNYEQLFKFNLSKILQYVEYYSEDVLPSSLTNEQKANIKKLWKYKNTIYKEDHNSPLAQESGIYVDKGDSFETKMGYNLNQIKIYQVLWGNNYNVENAEQKTALQIEWANLRNTGSHTDYYKNNYRNGHTPYEIDDNGNIKYFYYSNDDKKTVDENNWVSDLERAGDANYNSSLDAFEDGYYDENSAQQAAANNADEVNKLKNKYNYNLPERTGSKNGDNNTTDIDTIVTSANSFMDNQEGDINTISEDNIKNLSDSIYNILLIVGVIIAVIVGAIIGIKFMTGSVEQKANIKELLIPYIVGCVVIFGAFGIWKIVVLMLKDI